MVTSARMRWYPARRSAVLPLLPWSSSMSRIRSLGHGQVDQGVLPFPGFDVIEDLLGFGLADVDDGQPAEVPIVERRRPHTEAGRHVRSDGPVAGWSDTGDFRPVSGAHGLPPGWLEARRPAGPRFG